MSLAPDIRPWWYVSEGRRTGPISSGELHRLLSGGTLLPDTLVWKQGMTGWLPAGSLPEFSQTFSSLPPEIPSAPQKSAGSQRQKRGFFGTLFLVIFLVFNALMVWWLLSYWAEIGGSLDQGSEAARTGAAVGATIGTSVILFIWALGAVITGLLALLTRRR